MSDTIEQRQQLENKSKNWRDYLVEIECPKCGDKFSRSHSSTAWNCGKCRKYISRPLMRQLMYDALTDAGFTDLPMDEFQGIKAGRPPESDNDEIENNKEEEEMSEEDNDKLEKTEMSKKRPKITPVYASDVKDSIFDKPGKLKEKEKPEKKPEDKPEPSKMEQLQDKVAVVPVAKEVLVDIKDIVEISGLGAVFSAGFNYLKKRTDREELKILKEKIEMGLPLTEEEIIILEEKYGVNFDEVEYEEEQDQGGYSYGGPPQPIG